MTYQGFLVSDSMHAPSPRSIECEMRREVEFNVSATYPDSLPSRTSKKISVLNP